MFSLKKNIKKIGLISITSILIILITLFIPYSRYCSMFLTFLPCGKLKGWPFPVLEYTCIKNCISRQPNNPDSISSWVPVDGFVLFLISNFIFWFFIILFGYFINKLFNLSKDI